jgi:hypothetical protein
MMKVKVAELPMEAIFNYKVDAIREHDNHF